MAPGTEYMSDSAHPPSSPDSLGSFQLPVSNAPEDAFDRWVSRIDASEPPASPETREPSESDDNPAETRETSDSDVNKADIREQERAAKHATYIARSSDSERSLVGTYVVDCERIEQGWAHIDERQPFDMKLSIRTTPLPAIYQATFDFGILEGVMMLSADPLMLSFFSEQEVTNLGAAEQDPAGKEGDEEGRASDIGSDSDGAGRLGPGGKRKAVRSGTPRPPKAARTCRTDAGYGGSLSTSEAALFHLCMRSTDKGSGQINPRPDPGTVTADAGFEVLVGTADMDCVGHGVPFRARKISDSAEASTARWEDYGWAAYEYSCAARW